MTRHSIARGLSLALVTVPFVLTAGFSQVSGIRVFANNEYALSSNDVDYVFQGGRFASLTRELRNRSDAYIEFTGGAKSARR